MDDRSSQPPSGLAFPAGSGNRQGKRRRAGIIGVGFRLLIAAGIVAGTGIYAVSRLSEEKPEPRRFDRERSFTVAAVPAEPATWQPNIAAYGEVLAGRSLEVRAQVSGEAIQVSPSLVTGGRVRAGDILVQIDPFAYDGAVADATTALADAELQLTIALQQVASNQANLNAARDQLELAQRDLERAQTLLDTSDSGSDKLVDDRRLIVTQRLQTVEQAESALAIQQATVDRQQAAISRAQWILDQATRARNNTEIKAPFDGVITSAAASAGRIVSSGDVIAALYAPDSLEVRFTLSDQQYGQLESVGLVGSPVTVTWQIDPNPVSAAGTIVREGAVVDSSFGGVEFFAALDPVQGARLRPGTYVEVTIGGPTYEDALRIPESALYEDDHFYVIRDNRLARVDAQILARDGAQVILDAEVAGSERIVTTHLAQAGEGVLVAIEGEDPPAGQGAPGVGGRFGGGGGPPGGGRGGGG